MYQARAKCSPTVMCRGHRAVADPWGHATNDYIFIHNLVYQFLIDYDGERNSLKILKSSGVAMGGNG